MNGKGNILLLSLLLVAFLTMIHPVPSFGKTEVIPLRFRSAAEVEDMVRGMLSADGRLSVDQRTNVLLITDKIERIEQIKNILARIDQPARMVKIRLRFHEADSSRAGKFSGSARISGDNWEITTGPEGGKGKTKILLSDQTRARSGEEEFFVQVESGTSAYLKVGEEIPFQESWRGLCEKYGDHHGAFGFKKVESGIEVKPIIAGDRVILEVTPIIAYREKGQERGVIRFSKASTKLNLQLGQWVTLGSSRSKGNEVVRRILERGSEKNDRRIVISLKVEGCGGF